LLGFDTRVELSERPVTKLHRSLDYKVAICGLGSVARGQFVGKLLFDR
jgi:hypothetical protein